MHLDPITARRTQAGTPVVHGIHSVLWALDRFLASGNVVAQATRLKADFRKFVTIDEPVELVIKNQSESAATLVLIQKQSVVTKLSVFFDPQKPMRASVETAKIDPENCLGKAADEPSFDSLHGTNGYLNTVLDQNDLSLKALAAETTPEFIKSFALLSSLVGMVCPGLHSIFAGFDVRLNLDTDASDGVFYQVQKVDDRFRMITTEVCGVSFRGIVTSFYREPPVRAPSISVLQKRITPAEFKDINALIIGGTRGLGEATSKLISAGGGSCVATYFRGEADAKALEDEINQDVGRAALACKQFDANSDPLDLLRSLNTPFTHLFFFASPQIFEQNQPFFDAERLDRYLRVYVVGFERLVQALVTVNPNQQIHVYYPSSIAVEMRPKGMTEYAMAKAAGEILCADLQTVYKQLTFSLPRLPRILTDQTATVPPVPSADAVDIMLGYLREL